jgi:small GTP-binding protein
LYTIGLVGIDNAGKTTILNIFTKRRLTKTIPTVGVNLEELSFSKIDMDLSVLDMGGQKNFRLLWVDYLNCVDVIIYVIDASDYDRLDEAIKEFQNMLVLTEASNIPILILLNKVDLPNTITAVEIGQRLSKLDELSSREWNIIEASSITTKGLVDMFQWVYTKMTGHKFDMEVSYKAVEDREYYSPCPLLLEEADGNYCLNHDSFTPVKLVPLDTLFTGDFIDTDQVIRETIEEFDKLGTKVCFNSVFAVQENENMHCATDKTTIDVEGITASKDEYIESYNMMQLTGGVMCSSCLYKILFSAVRRRLKAGETTSKETIDNIKEVEYQSKN